jgi:hypothetical protein
LSVGRRHKVKRFIAAKSGGKTAKCPNLNENSAWGGLDRALAGG